MRKTLLGWACFVVTLLLASPAWVSAQGNGAISGTLKDATGAVLPGVTVEASSPALIEKVRSAVSDGAGQYKIVSLPPGTYVVTFSLSGFSTVRREGIELTTGFTANVDGDMRVGAVSETIVVSGQAPVVDVQNARRQVVMARDVVDALPTGRVLVEIATLVPGVQMINGGAGATGSGGSAGADQFATLTAHGARSDDTQLEVNGMSVNIFGIRQDSSYMNFQDGNVQEYQIEVSGHSAETETGGVRVNMIPKEGGNQFSGGFFVHFANSAMQSDNMSDELRAKGLGDPDKIKSLWTANPSIGGPVVRDKLWFYGGYSRMVIQRYKAGTYVNATPTAFQPTFDLSQQVIAGEHTHDANVRLTWQATAKNKLSFYYDRNILCQCPYLVGRTYIGNNTLDGSNDSPRKTHLFQGTWTAPITSRLLLETSTSLPFFTTDKIPFPFSTEPRIMEQSIGLGFRYGSVTFDEKNTNQTYKGAVSYVTGSHAAKFGVNAQRARADRQDDPNDLIRITTLNYRPVSIAFRSAPGYGSYRDQLALYAQDQWTIRRLTLNLGLRYDYYSNGYPDIQLAAERYVPIERSFPGAQLVGWHDVNPRLGVALDVFGTGKTAVKASLGRYVVTEGTFGGHPGGANTSLTRTWTDPNRDFIVQGDPLNPAANGELGPSTNLNFGVPRITNRYDDDYAFGLNRRTFNWETGASVQHELIAGVSATLAFHRRWYGNFEVSDNLLVSPADYDPFCVTVPTDSRLPEGSGEQLCGLYDLNPAKRGLSNTLITSSAQYGDRYENWQGYDLSMQARLRGGLFLSGGVSAGRTVTDQCDVAAKIDNPSLQFCHLETPYLPQYKLGTSYTMPWGIQIAGTLQSFAGPGVQANATFTNAQVAPSLGRNLSSGVTVSVPLLPGGTGANPANPKYYGDRLTQIDLRFGKTLRFGGTRVRAMVDLYNAANVGTVVLHNNTYGPAWLRPQGIAQGRLVKLGAQLDF